MGTLCIAQRGNSKKLPNTQKARNIGLSQRPSEWPVGFKVHRIMPPHVSKGTPKEQVRYFMTEFHWMVVHPTEEGRIVSSLLPQSKIVNW